MSVFLWFNWLTLRTPTAASNLGAIILWDNIHQICSQLFNLSLHLLSMCAPNTVHEYSFESFRFLCQSVDMKESSTETQRDFQKVCAWSQYRRGEFMNECVKVLSQRRCYVSHAFLSGNPWLMLESIRRIPAYHRLHHCYPPQLIVGC